MGSACLIILPLLYRNSNGYVGIAAGCLTDGDQGAHLNLQLRSPRKGPALDGVVKVGSPVLVQLVDEEAVKKMTSGPQSRPLPLCAITLCHCLKSLT